MQSNLLLHGETGNTINATKIAITSVEDVKEMVKGGEVPIK